MKSFKQYLAESINPHYLAIKLAVKPTDQQLEVIEDMLKRYDLIDISAPEEIRDTDDFFDIPHEPIYCMLCQVGVPVSSYILMQDIRAALHLNEKYVVVRASNEPFELEAEDVAFHSDADKKAQASGMTSRARLSTDREYDPAEQPVVTDLYGNDYNMKLLDYLAGIAANRPSKEVDAPSPLFSWLDMQKVAPQEPTQSGDDFNAGHDTPKPVLKSKGEKAVDPLVLGPYGNLDDRATQNVKLLKTKAGKDADMTQRRAEVKGKK